MYTLTCCWERHTSPISVLLILSQYSPNWPVVPLGFFLHHSIAHRFLKELAWILTGGRRCWYTHLAVLLALGRIVAVPLPLAFGPGMRTAETATEEHDNADSVPLVDPDTLGTTAMVNDDTISLGPSVSSVAVWPVAVSVCNLVDSGTWQVN